MTPLSYDEAYYWTWSQHLAGGYYDHPPMVALVIRLGTLIAGDTEFGVRLASILLALPMSFAVYRASQLLFHDERIAASATLLLNATLMVAAGTLIVTPDAPLMVASAFVLYALAKVLETGRGVWWLGVGLAVGLALLSKYTALLFGVAILAWLLARAAAAAVAALALALSRRHRRLCVVRARDHVERRPSVGVVHQAARPCQGRQPDAAVLRRD